MNTNKLLSGYIEHLIISGVKPSDVARRTAIAAELLQQLPVFGKVAYRNYRKANIGSNSWLKYGATIEDFAAFAFRHGTYTAPVKQLKSLERLQTVSDRNNEDIGSFILWLMSQREYSENTLNSYRYTLADFFSYANEFDNNSCRCYIQTMKERGFKPRTLNVRMNALRAYARYKGVKIALSRIKVARQLSTENIPSVAEFNKLCDYLKAHNYKLYLIVSVAGHTGARLSELLQMKYSDIVRGECSLTGKGNKCRNFFFPKQLSAEVASYVREIKPASDYLCWGKYGEVMTDRGVSTMIKDYGMKAGIRKEVLHPHAFRHFFAKQYLKNSKDIAQLAMLLGHARLDTTSIYLQKSYEEQKRDFSRNVTW